MSDLEFISWLAKACALHFGVSFRQAVDDLYRRTSYGKISKKQYLALEKNLKKYDLN